MAKQLRTAGITRAFVSSMDAVLYPDPAVCDSELFKTVSAERMLIPVPTVNPCFSDWRTRAAGTGLRAVRIVPNYHQYALDAPAVTCLVDVLSKARMPLIIQMRVDDERNQYPLMKVPGVDCESIIRLANAHKTVPFVCLCAYRYEAVQLVKKTKNVSVDIAFIESFKTLPTLLKEIPAERVLFGSYTPFCYTASAVAKLDALRKMAGTAYKAIAYGNAVRVFGARLTVQRPGDSGPARPQNPVPRSDPPSRAWRRRLAGRPRR